MAHGNITPEDGSILPVKYPPWGRSAEKLREAEMGILQMKSAKDRISFEQGWTRFVDSIEEFWNRFYFEGKNEHRRFSGWISLHNQTRKSDELLRYVTQARHQSQHGNIALNWEPESGFAVGQGFAGTFSTLDIKTDGTFETDALPGRESPKPFSVQFDPGRAALPTVVNRMHNQSFPPPTRHRGNELIQISPIVAAQLTFQFYAGLLESAKQEFPERDILGGPKS